MSVLDAAVGAAVDVAADVAVGYVRAVDSVVWFVAQIRIVVLSGCGLGYCSAHHQRVRRV